MSTGCLFILCSTSSSCVSCTEGFTKSEWLSPEFSSYRSLCEDAGERTETAPADIFLPCEPLFAPDVIKPSKLGFSRYLSWLSSPSFSTLVLTRWMPITGWARNKLSLSAVSELVNRDFLNFSLSFLPVAYFCNLGKPIGTRRPPPSD